MPVQCRLCPIDVSPEHEADDVPLCDNHLRFNPDVNTDQNLPAAITELTDMQEHKPQYEYNTTQIGQEQGPIGVSPSRIVAFRYNVEQSE